MKLYVGVLLIGVCVSPFNAVACTTPVSVCESTQQGSVPLIENGRPVDVVYETSTNMAVQIAIENFANDLKRISGKRAKLIADPKKFKKPTEIVGVLGQSKLLEELIAAKTINVDQLRSQWEAYQIAVVEHPWPDVESALVIVGSDRRGAVYGIYDLSEN